MMRIAFLAVVGMNWVVQPARSQARELYRGAPIKYLEGTVLSQPNVLSFPSAIAVVGTRILVLDPGADSLLIVLDMTTGRVIGRAIAIGPGRGQLRSGVGFVPRGESSISILDGLGKELVTYDFVDDYTGAIRRRASTISLSMGGVVTAAAWSMDSSLIASGFFPGRRFIKARPGVPPTPFGPAPLGEASIAVRARQQAYLTILAPRPDLAMFAAATLYADRLDVFSSTGHVLAKASRPSPFEPGFAVYTGPQGPTMALNRNRNRFGYLGLSGTATSIFALYSGRGYSDAPGSESFGAIVHQFGWDGQYRRVLVLDRDVYAIAVDHQGLKLFALSFRPIPAVIVYSLRSGSRPTAHARIREPARSSAPLSRP